MGTKNYIRVYLLLALCVSAIARAQEDIVSPSSGKHPQEEIYLQTDKDIYETAENLWFKGYVVNAQLLAPSPTSQTLYISLLRLPSKTPVWEEKYAVANGFTNGHIYVNDTLQSGHYALVAHTGLSVSPDDAEISTARIIEIIKNTTALEGRNKFPSLEIPKDSISFILMAEGGYPVAGLMGRVAFKAVNPKGQPVDVSGTLYDGTKALLHFKSQHAGMGSFYVTPRQNANYVIKVDGCGQSFPFPQVVPAGQLLQLVRKDETVAVFKVAQNSGLPTQKMQLRLQSRGLGCGSAEFELKDEALIKIQLADVPAGIAEVTLLNAAGQPVAERLLYVHDRSRLNLKATLNKQRFGPKQQVVLTINAADANGTPVAASFGVSVADVIYSNPGNTQNIESHFKLSAQLRGSIYDPAYYFDPKNTNRQQALDLLLLTQGWRAYRWVEQQQNPAALVTDTLTGSIYARKKKAAEKLGGQYIAAFFADGQSASAFLETDEMGEYQIPPEALMYNRRGNVYFKLLYANNDIKMNKIADAGQDYFRKYDAQKTLPLPIPVTTLKKEPPLGRFDLNNGMRQLDEVVITAKTNKPRRFADKYMGTLDSIAKFERNTDFVCANWMLNCPIPAHRLNSRPPVEGEIYSKAENIKDAGLPGGAWLVVGSALHMPYRFPKFTEDQLMEKFNLARVKGYYPEKEFYSPVYDDVTPDAIPDYRNTLYWNPLVITDENGNAEVTFYSSDISSEFVVNIEGITAEGLMGTAKVSFKTVLNK